MKHQKGFAVLEGLLILVIIAIIGGTGWYVMKAKTQANKTLDNTSATGGSSATTTQVGAKTYTDPNYGFSFQYPSNWKLVKDLKDMGRGGPEGRIYVESPSGTKVHFDPNFGGKGGDCADPQANEQRTTRTCTTRTILSVDKLPASGSKAVWLEKGSDTDPTEAGGKTSYFVYLTTGYYNYDTDKYSAPQLGSTIGVFLGAWDDVQLKNAALNVFVEGKDDSNNSTNAFFESREVKEAIPVFESFKIL